MKISTIIITLGVVSVLVLLISLSMFNIGKDYGVTYNNATANKFDKIEKLNNISQQVKSEVSNVTETTNPLSSLDAFFASGYNVIKMLIITTDVATDTGTEIINTIPATDNKAEIQNILGGFLVMLIVALIIIGVILKVLVKTDV